MGMKINSSITKWLPMIAVIGALYQVYAERGFEGLLADLRAITYEGVKAKAQTWLIGIGLILIAKPGGSYIPSPTLRPVATAVLYYIGMNQIFDAIQQGANMSSGGNMGRAWIQQTQEASQPMTINSSRNAAGKAANMSGMI